MFGLHPEKKEELLRSASTLFNTGFQLFALLQVSGSNKLQHSEKKEEEEDEEVPTNFTKQGKKTKEVFSIKTSKITLYRQKFLLKFLDQAELVPVSEGLQVAAEEMQP